MTRSRERGSILVELVVAVPLLVIATLVIVQGVVLASGLASVEVAAKDAARAAADSCSVVAPGEAARRAVSRFVHVSDVAVSRAGDTYSAQVSATVRLTVMHMATGEFAVARSAAMPRLSSCR